MEYSEFSHSLIPFNTGIVFTSGFPTPLLKTSTLTIEPSPIISVSQDSNPGAVSLGISQDSASQDTSSSLIQATPSTSTINSTNILSPDEKEKEKLKEGSSFFDSLLYF